MWKICWANAESTVLSDEHSINSEHTKRGGNVSAGQGLYFGKIQCLDHQALLLKTGPWDDQFDLRTCCLGRGRPRPTRRTKGSIQSKYSCAHFERKRGIFSEDDHISLRGGQRNQLLRSLPIASRILRLMNSHFGRRCGLETLDAGTGS